MLEGAGFDVIDLGINNPVENILMRSRNIPDILDVRIAHHNHALHESGSDAMVKGHP